MGRPDSRALGVLLLVFVAAGTVFSQQTSQTPAAAQPTPVPVKPKTVQDWANLGKYRAENALLAAPAADEKRVVFMGDSITDGWGRGKGTGSFFPGKPYLNRGISGQTTPQMLIRFEQDVVHLRPAVVVINAGTNDVAGNTGPSTPEMIEDNLAAMTAIAKANGIAVVLSSITPAIRYPWKPEIDSVGPIRMVNKWMQQFCARKGCTYLNYYDAMADAQGGMMPGLSGDGVHPLAKGYDIMTPLAEDAIAKALAAKMGRDR